MGILVCGNPVRAGGLSVSWLLLILFTVPSPLSVQNAICQSAQGGCRGSEFSLLCLREHAVYLARVSKKRSASQHPGGRGADAAVNSLQVPAGSFAIYRASHGRACNGTHPTWSPPQGDFPFPTRRRRLKPGIPSRSDCDCDWE